MQQGRVIAFLIGFVIFAMSVTSREDYETVPIADLAPTQVAVGMREVDVKRRHWRESSGSKATDYLNAHRVPVVLGPHARAFMIDRHHLALALHHEGIRRLPVSIIANMSALGFDEFWATLEGRSWTHPFDDQGRRRFYNEMPASVHGLIDDPFRSLAGALKRAGGYAKDNAPFSEFRWADFLRHRIPRELTEQNFRPCVGIGDEFGAGNRSRSVTGLAVPQGFRASPWSGGPGRTDGEGFYAVRDAKRPQLRCVVWRITLPLIRPAALCVTRFNRRRPTCRSRRRIARANGRARAAAASAHIPARIVFLRVVTVLTVVALGSVITLLRVVALGIGRRAFDIGRPRGVGRAVLAIDRCRCTIGRTRRPIRGLAISVTGLGVRLLPDRPVPGRT